MTELASRRPSPLVFWSFIGLMVALTALFVTLGVWQVQRLDEKEAQIAAVAARTGLAPVPVPAAGDWPGLDVQDFDYRPVTLEGTFDFVFLDAWKKDYQRFFDLVFPRLDAGGLFVAHNVLNKKSEMGDFLETIETHPALWTTIVAPSGEGVSVSLKRRGR